VNSSTAYWAAGAIHGVFRRVFCQIKNALVYIGEAIYDGRNTPRFHPRRKTLRNTIAPALV